MLNPSWCRSGYSRYDSFFEKIKHISGFAIHYRSCRAVNDFVFSGSSHRYNREPTGKRFLVISWSSTVSRSTVQPGIVDGRQAELPVRDPKRGESHSSCSAARCNLAVFAESAPTASSFLDLTDVAVARRRQSCWPAAGRVRCPS